AAERNLARGIGAGHDHVVDGVRGNAGETSDTVEANVGDGVSTAAEAVPLALRAHTDQAADGEVLASVDAGAPEEIALEVSIDLRVEVHRFDLGRVEGLNRVALRVVEREGSGDRHTALGGR